MFKLYKNFKAKDWFCVVLIMGLVVLQVYLTMTIVDYIQNIIEAITFVNYHNHPEGISKELAQYVSIMGWDGIKASASMLGSMGDMIVKVADASVADIWINGGIMVALAAGIMVVQALISVIASYVAANLSTSIRGKLYKKVESFSLAEINRFSTPSLVTRCTNDIQQVQMANLLTMRMIFAAPVTAIWAICKIQASSTELTIATAVAIILLLIFISLVMIIALPKFKIMQHLTDNLNGVTRENLTGIRIVRAFNAEKYQEEKFTKANTEITNTQIFTGKVMAMMSPVMMIIMNGISLAIYWIGASLINKGKIDYATVTSFMMLSSQIIMSFVMLMMLFMLWPRAIVSAKRINEVLDTKLSIVNPEVSEEFKECGTIEFKNVSFKYPDGDSDAIENISFKANQGETIAIIGAIGSGKSTLVNLICRLYDATDGEVLVDGVNVKNVNQHKLRSVIGYVPQKRFLFSGSIKSNVSFGNLNLTDEEIVAACKVSEADGFIREKEEGYDFKISQGGKNVSGGQNQRLCIARAVAINPEIYIFDDSFSALDYKTDKKVRENLKENNSKATKVIVAQRIGTIMDADQIIVLSDGKIVGHGKHHELLKDCPTYLEIALSQLSKEELGL